MISPRRYLHAARGINKPLAMLSVSSLVHISTTLGGYNASPFREDKD